MKNVEKYVKIDLKIVQNYWKLGKDLTKMRNKCEKLIKKQRKSWKMGDNWTKVWKIVRSYPKFNNNYEKMLKNTEKFDKN